MADSRNAVARDMRPTEKAASEARTCRSTRSETGAGRRRPAPRGGGPSGNDRASSSAASSSAAACRVAANAAASIEAARAAPESNAASQWAAIEDGGPPRPIARAA